MTTLQTEVLVRVRYFAAASAAAGVKEEDRPAPAGATVGDLIMILGDRNSELARVLQRCSYLCDGIAVRDLGAVLRSGQTIDVLPPFAGG
jgi:sulfur-carrier protein